MTIGAALVLFAVVWFMVLFVVLPLRIKTQADTGEIVPGTPSSAPAELNLKRKLVWTTVTSVILWAIFAAIIIYRLIPLEIFDFYNLP